METDAVDEVSVVGLGDATCDETDVLKELDQKGFHFATTTRGIVEMQALPSLLQLLAQRNISVGNISCKIDSEPYREQDPPEGNSVKGNHQEFMDYIRKNQQEKEARERESHGSFHSGGGFATERHPDGKSSLNVYGDLGWDRKDDKGNVTDQLSGHGGGFIKEDGTVRADAQFEYRHNY